MRQPAHAGAVGFADLRLRGAAQAAPPKRRTRWLRSGRMCRLAHHWPSSSAGKWQPFLVARREEARRGAASPLSTACPVPVRHAVCLRCQAPAEAVNWGGAAFVIRTHRVSFGGACERADGGDGWGGGEGEGEEEDMGDGVRRAGRCMHEREGELETWRGMEVKGRYHYKSRNRSPPVTCTCATKPGCGSKRTGTVTCVCVTATRYP